MFINVKPRSQWRNYGGAWGRHDPPFTPSAPHCPPPHLTFDCAPFIAMRSSCPPPHHQMKVCPSLPPPPPPKKERKKKTVTPLQGARLSAVADPWPVNESAEPHGAVRIVITCLLHHDNTHTHTHCTRTELLTPHSYNYGYLDFRVYGSSGGRAVRSQTVNCHVN